MRRLMTLLISIGLAVIYLCSSIAFAETIKIQNANFASGVSKIVVSGKLVGFGKSNQVTIKDTLTGEILAELSGVKKNFNTKIFRNMGQAVPCSVTVTSVDTFASRDVRHAPGDCSNRFTLSGIVTDMALPYATVVVHVGGQTFTTVADENGFYSLDIATASVGDLVIIEAEAASPNDPGETVNLISLAGTFSKLLSDPVENVTNVTTAEFALLIKANGGQIPTTEQELRDAETHVDATALLELAAVIKLIVDDPATYPLPDGFDSIIEFIGDGAAVALFIAATDPNSIAETIVAILADNDLVEGFTVADIPSFYYGVQPANPGFLSRGGVGIEFDDSSYSGAWLIAQGGGSGIPLSEEFDWWVTEGILELNFPNATVHSSVQYDPGNATSDQSLIDYFYDCAVDPAAGIGAHHRSLSSSITRIVDGSLVDIASVTDWQENTFDEVPTKSDPPCTGEPIIFSSSLSSETYELTLRSSTDITAVPFTAGPGGVDVQGSWGFSYFYNAGADLYYPTGRRVLGNLLTFDANGTGSKLFDDEDLVDQTFTWHIVDGDLVFNYPDGWTQTSRILDQEGKQYGVFSDYTNGTDRFAHYDIAVKQDPSFTLTQAELLTPAGSFWNSVINHWVPYYQQDDGSWLYGSHWGWIFESMPNGTHPVAQWREGFRYWTETSMTWGILPDGMLQRNYVVVPWIPERQRFWTPLAEDSITIDPITGDPIVPATKRFYVLEYENQGPDRRIQPRINIQQLTDIPEYDIYEFCTPTPEWSCTTTP